MKEKITIMTWIYNIHGEWSYSETMGFQDQLFFSKEDEKYWKMTLSFGASCRISNPQICYRYGLVY